MPCTSKTGTRAGQVSMPASLATAPRERGPGRPIFDKRAVFFAAVSISACLDRHVGVSIK